MRSPKCIEEKVLFQNHDISYPEFRMATCLGNKWMKNWRGVNNFWGSFLMKHLYLTPNQPEETVQRKSVEWRGGTSQCRRWHKRGGNKFSLQSGFLPLSPLAIHFSLVLWILRRNFHPFKNFTPPLHQEVLKLNPINFWWYVDYLYCDKIMKTHIEIERLWTGLNIYTYNAAIQ
jgi:hypothetical protein